MSCADDAVSEQWYEKLRDEVDYHCSFYEGLQLEVSELEAKAKAAYASTARSMRGLYDQREIATRWLGMWYFAAELLGIAKAARDAHQICATDISGLQGYYNDALEHFPFHCPAQVKMQHG